MTAKEAVDFIKNCPDTTLTDILNVIPKYSNDLPRRAWVKYFMSHIPQDLLKKFSDLK